MCSCTTNLYEGCDILFIKKQVICDGEGKNNKVRNRKEMKRVGIRTKFRTWFWTSLAKRHVRQYGLGLGVHYKSVFNNNTVLGDDCHFNGMEITGYGNVIIGSHFHSGKNCSIITHIHNYEGEKLPYDNKLIHKDVKIGKNVWIGDSVIILGGAVIEDGAIIQAGSVVTGHIPFCAIAGGHPAKPFKYRNIEHYKKLADKQLD